MVVSRTVINDMIRDRLHTVCVIDQTLNVAKYIISKQIQKPTSEMIAFYMPNGDVGVTPSNPQENRNEV